jgi:hypothetical protein
VRYSKVGIGWYLGKRKSPAFSGDSEHIIHQKVAGEIDAIKNIGGIIGGVNGSPRKSRSTQHAAQGTKNVSDNISGVKADADAAAAAARISARVETGNQSQQLGSQVSDFLGNIRAA